MAITGAETSNETGQDISNVYGTGQDMIDFPKVYTSVIYFGMTITRAEFFLSTTTVNRVDSIG